MIFWRREFFITGHDLESPSNVSAIVAWHCICCAASWWLSDRGCQVARRKQAVKRANSIHEHHTCISFLDNSSVYTTLAGWRLCTKDVMMCGSVDLHNATTRRRDVRKKWFMLIMQEDRLRQTAACCKRCGETKWQNTDNGNELWLCVSNACTMSRKKSRKYEVSSAT